MGSTPMRTDFWTKERITTLERLWAQGRSAGTIAKTLGGISRSAVLGKIFRLRLGDAPKPAPKTERSAKAVVPAPPKPRAKDRGPARRRGVVATAPPARAPPDRIEQFQDYWDQEFSGDLARRSARVRLIVWR